MNLATVILAAGQGTRMRSKLAKVLHPIGERSMIARAVDLAWTLNDAPPVVVVGHDAAAVQAHIGDRARYAMQAEMRGTGHAVKQAQTILQGQSDLVLVCYADMPLLTSATITHLITSQAASSAPFTLLTVHNPTPRGFGRIVRDPDSGAVRQIVEETDTTDAQKKITELNVGCYVFDAAWLWAHIDHIQPNPKRGEYFLTDMVQIAVDYGAFPAGILSNDPDEVIGVNTRIDLADAEVALRRRVCRRWQLAGVTIRDPATTYISEATEIGQDTIIEPNTHLKGRTIIGADSVIGPNTVIIESTIGADCTVNASMLEYATVEDHVQIGPFAHLRTGAYLCEGVHMGNFGEVKNSRLGARTRMGHFSYVGDSDVGADVNIGGGVITANFDGKRKHRTIIGDRAFLGSDTILRAPVTLGEGARTGAGSVVTRDVPSDHLAVGVPARMRRIVNEEKD